MIVVDASTLLEVPLRGPCANRVGARLLAHGAGVAAPHLIDLEVAQGPRRIASRGLLSAERAAQAFEDLAAMSITRCAHRPCCPGSGRCATP